MTCGSSCQWGACVQPPIALASNEDTPSLIFVDATNVYWRSSADIGSLRTVPRSGGTATTYGSDTNLGNPGGLTLRNGAGFTTRLGGCNLGAGVSQNNGETFVFAGSGPLHFYNNQKSPVAVTLDATNVYWLNAGNFKCVPTGGGTFVWNFAGWSHDGSGAIMMAPLNFSSGATELVTGLNPTDSFDPTGTNAIAVDGSYVYWTETIAGVKRALLTGGGVVVIDAHGAAALATDGAHVFWTTPGQGTVTQAESGGANSFALATGQSPYGIVVDGTNVYWANTGTQANNHQDGAIVRVAIGGGTPVVVVSGQYWPRYLAVDGSQVFWTNAAGQVMAASK